MLKMEIWDRAIRLLPQAWTLQIVQNWSQQLQGGQGIFGCPGRSCHNDYDLHFGLAEDTPCLGFVISCGQYIDAFLVEELIV